MNICILSYKVFALYFLTTIEVAGMKTPRIIAIFAGYSPAIILSGYIVRFFVGRPPADNGKTSKEGSGSGFDTGALIGKCENILTITFILAGEITGLALMFAAKSLIREDSINADAG